MRPSVSRLTVFLLGLLTCVCLADSWAPPAPQVFLSETKAYRFTVRPPNFTSLDAFLALDREDFVMVTAYQQQNTNGQVYCEGILERRDEKGDYILMWRRPLVNRVAPSSVFISEVGPSVVTFDDWFHVGTSSNTVVIYSQIGKLVGCHRLSDLLSDSEIKQLTHSVSSISWQEKVGVDAGSNRLVLTIPKRMPVFIDLQTGRVVNGNGSNDAPHATAAAP